MLVAVALIWSALYRLRGGWWRNLTGSQRWYNGTNVMRLIWSVPTALLVWWLTSAPWWLIPAGAASWFCSMAFWGHGAHFCMDAEIFARSKGAKTELLTSWWLPKLFGGVPDETWLETRHDDINLYSVTGMTFIGIVRHLTASVPLWFVAEPWHVAAFVAAGATHGVCYWLGWKIADGEFAEVIVGAMTGAVIVALWG